MTAPKKRGERNGTDGNKPCLMITVRAHHLQCQASSYMHLLSNEVEKGRGTLGGCNGCKEHSYKQKMRRRKYFLCGEKDLKVR